MVNYVTPGYATAVYVSASGVQRVRTTAESHRRIAIVEVMGRHSGYLALGSMYGQRTSCWCPNTGSTWITWWTACDRFTTCKNTS